MNKNPVDKKGDGELLNAEHIAALVTGYLQKSLDHTHHDELDQWVRAKKTNMLLFEEITDEKKLQMGLEVMEEADIKEALEKCKKRISFDGKPKPPSSKGQCH
ncbi:MAG: hypothetical protein ABIR18_14050 [Chitinophagaceae bacterium]